MAGAKARPTAALWSVVGPARRSWAGEVQGDNGEWFSTSVCPLDVAGDYEVACTFQFEGGKSERVEWHVTSLGGESFAVGRKMDDSLIGQMAFIKGGEFMMGKPAGAPSEEIPSFFPREMFPQIDYEDVKRRVQAALQEMPAEFRPLFEGVLDPDAAWTPQHKVRVGDFYMSKFLVTAGEFCDFLNKKGNPDYLYLFGDGAWSEHRGKVVEYYRTQYWDKVSEDAPSRDKLRRDRHKLETLESFLWLEQGWLCNIERDAESGHYRPRGEARYAPANCVTWLGAAEYCRWLSQRTGRIYRLPTEAEWEYAARGPEGRAFPWGDAPPFAEGGRSGKDEHTPLGLYEQTFGLRCRFPYVNVGSFPSGNTPDGMSDMVGYLYQWCSDAYWIRYYENSPLDNPRGPDVPPEQMAFAPRTLRGGESIGRGNVPASWFRVPSLPDLVYTGAKGWMERKELLLQAEEAVREMRLAASGSGEVRPVRPQGKSEVVEPYPESPSTSIGPRYLTIGFRVVMEPQ